MRKVIWIAVALWFSLTVACAQEEETPTPAPEMQATATIEREEAAPTATEEPVPSPTDVPTETPAPTTIPDPTATLIPTPTPLQLTMLGVTVTEAGTGNPVPGATVTLANEAVGFDASYTTDAAGEASFISMEPTTTSLYTVRVTASGYQPVEMEVVLKRGITKADISLEAGVVGTTTTVTNLRASPRFDADVLAEIPADEALPILEVSVDEEWLRVRTAEDQEGWIFANLLEIEGDLAAVGEAPARPTVTPAATGSVTPSATAAVTPTVGATATPAAEGALPPRPAPVPFAAENFRDSMAELRATLEALGGYYDRIAAGGDPDCEGFVALYGDVNAITTYSTVPEDWLGLHELYVDVADDVLDSNEDVYLTCVQGGEVSPLNRSRARMGINEALERLVPLLRLADSRLEEG